MDVIKYDEEFMCLKHFFDKLSKFGDGADEFCEKLSDHEILNVDKAIEDALLANDNALIKEFIGIFHLFSYEYWGDNELAESNFNFWRKRGIGRWDFGNNMILFDSYSDKEKYNTKFAIIFSSMSIVCISQYNNEFADLDDNHFNVYCESFHQFMVQKFGPGFSIYLKNYLSRFGKKSAIFNYSTIRNFDTTYYWKDRLDKSIEKYKDINLEDLSKVLSEDIYMDIFCIIRGKYEKAFKRSGYSCRTESKDNIEEVKKGDFHTTSPVKKGYKSKIGRIASNYPSIQTPGINPLHPDFSMINDMSRRDFVVPPLTYNPGGKESQEYEDLDTKMRWGNLSPKEERRYNILEKKYGKR